MRIAQIDVFQVDLPYSGGTYLLAGGREYRTFDATIVRVRTDDGLEGWGESTPFGATYIASHPLGVRAAIAQIAPALLGRDPRQVDRINDAMDSGLVGHADAKAPLVGHSVTQCRRQRDMCLAAGLTMNVQETTGSDVAFAAVVHLGQTVPERNLRCILECREMVSTATVEDPIPVIDGRASAPQAPGLGITPRLDVLGDPVATYTARHSSSVRRAEPERSVDEVSGSGGEKGHVRTA